MKPIQKIVCCCGSGLGSSLMVQMNAENALKHLGRSDIKVSHCSLSEADLYSSDLYIVGLDIAPRMKKCARVIVMKEIIAAEELERKLEQALAMQEQEQIYIE